MFILNDPELEQRKKKLFCKNVYKKIAFNVGEYVEDEDAQKSFSITSCDLTMDKKYGELRFQLSELIPEALQEEWKNIVKTEHFSLDDMANEIYYTFYNSLREKVRRFFHYAIDIREFVMHRLRNHFQPEIIVHYYVRFEIEGNLFQLQTKLENSILKLKEYHFSPCK